jgi:hypothetical protein
MKTAKEISEMLGKKPTAVRKLLVAMSLEQQVINTKGTYTHPTPLGSGNCSNYGNSGNSNHSVTLHA